MQIYGVVKKAELVRQAEWQTSLLVVTLDADGVELTFPVAKEEAAFLVIGGTQGFDVSANSAEYAAQLAQVNATEPDVDYAETAASNDNYVDPADYQTTVTDNDEDDSILTMTDSEMKDLYGVDDGIEPGGGSPIRVEGELERISADEVKQGKVEQSTPTTTESVNPKLANEQATAPEVTENSGATADLDRDDPISPLNLRPAVDDDDE